MRGKYQKFEIKMQRESDGCRLWKKRPDVVFCQVESYKERRSILFYGENLLPSSSLKEIQGREYHLLLIGSSSGEVFHRDFGPVKVSQMGEVQVFYRFEGAPLEAYAYCIFCIVDEEGEIEVLYKGEFFSQDEDAFWEQRCREEQRVEAFTDACDETGSQWFRIEDLEPLPKALEPCRKWIDPYHHYIIGRKAGRYYVGIPGRFLQKEQPLREHALFLLWQPIRGGEAFYAHPETMTPSEQERIFGYWIAEADARGEKLYPL